RRHLRRRHHLRRRLRLRLRLRLRRRRPCWSRTRCSCPPRSPAWDRRATRTKQTRGTGRRVESVSWQRWAYHSGAAQQPKTTEHPPARLRRCLPARLDVLDHRVGVTEVEGAGFVEAGKVGVTERQRGGGEVVV